MRSMLKNIYAIHYYNLKSIGRCGVDRCHISSSTEVNGSELQMFNDLIQTIKVLRYLDVNIVESPCR